MIRFLSVNISIALSYLDGEKFKSKRKEIITLVPADEYQYWKEEEEENPHNIQIGLDKIICIYHFTNPNKNKKDFHILLKLQCKSCPLYAEVIYFQDDIKKSCIYFTFHRQRFIDTAMLYSSSFNFNKHYMMLLLFCLNRIDTYLGAQDTNVITNNNDSDNEYIRKKLEKKRKHLFYGIICYERNDWNFLLNGNYFVKPLQL